MVNIVSHNNNKESHKYIGPSTKVHIILPI